MRKIKVSLSNLQKAVSRAASVSDGWQAVCLEILLLPNVNKRWREVSGYPNMLLERHNGAFYTTGLATQQEIPDWSVYAGYTLQFNAGLHWNVVGEGTERGYSHGPSRCWDGVRRETCGDIATFLSAAAASLSKCGTISNTCENILASYGIEVVDDRKSKEMNEGTN